MPRSMRTLLLVMMLAAPFSTGDCAVNAGIETLNRIEVL